MKTLLLSRCWLLLLVVGMWACGDGCPRTKTDFLQQYNQFIDGACRNNDGMSWEKRDEKLRKYVKTCYPKFKGELSVIEQGQFWWGSASYYYARYGKDVMNLATNDEILLEVKNNITALGKSFDDTIKEISDGWDSFINGVGKWWETIKGVF